MDQYIGTSNRPLSPDESREAVERFKALPSTDSPFRRHQIIAEAMTCSLARGVVRHISWQQVGRCIKRHAETGDARCEYHRNMKSTPIVKKHRKKSKSAMPTETKNLIVNLVLATCTLTAPQLREEIQWQLGETWSSTAIAKARRDAGFTRKRTTANKREACPIQQHNHAEALIALGYEVRNAARRRLACDQSTPTGELTGCAGTGAGGAHDIYRRNAQGCEGLVPSVRIRTVGLPCAR
jgi:hypothetical protein